MKKIRRIVLSGFIVAIMIGMQFNSVFAIAISKSVGSVAPGGTFSVTVSGLSNVRGKFNVSVSNGSGNTTFYVTGNDSHSVSITAGSSGTVSVSVGALDATNVLSEEPVQWSGSTTVQIVAPTTGGGTSNTPQVATPQTPVEDTRSKDNSLSGLTTSEGTLSPVFNKDTVDYSVNLDSKITKINIGATTTDAKATVSGGGEKAVSPGENVFEVIVTAENKSTKKYTIKVVVDETPTVFLEHGKQKLGVVRNLSDVTPPVGFEETSVTVNGEDVKAWTNGNMNKTILYMINENNEKSFYLYEDGKISSLFKPIALLGRNVYIVDVASDKQTLEGMKYQEVNIDGNVMMGWAFEDKAFANYSLISVMNEKGEMVYYQYENTENTMQLYDNGAPVTTKGYESAKKYETYTMIAGAIAIILAGATVVVTMFCIKYKKANVRIVEMVTNKSKD